MSDQLGPSSKTWKVVTTTGRHDDSEKKEAETGECEGGGDTVYVVIFKNPATEREEGATSSSYAGPSEPGISTKRRERRSPGRTFFRVSQVEVLKEVFERKRYITSDDVCQLAKQTNLTEKQVLAWFRNRRARRKTSPKDAESGANPDGVISVLSQITRVEESPQRLSNYPMDTSRQHTSGTLHGSSSLPSLPSHLSTGTETPPRPLSLCLPSQPLLSSPETPSDERPDLRSNLLNPLNDRLIGAFHTWPPISQPPIGSGTVPSLTSMFDNILTEMDAPHSLTFTFPTQTQDDSPPGT